MGLCHLPVLGTVGGREALHRRIHVGKFVSCQSEGGFSPEACSSQLSGLSSSRFGCQQSKPCHEGPRALPAKAWLLTAQTRWASAWPVDCVGQPVMTPSRTSLLRGIASNPSLVRPSLRLASGLCAPCGEPCSPAGGEAAQPAWRWRSTASPGAAHLGSVGPVSGQP